MSLRFIFGEAGTGKSKFCLDSIKERIKNNDNEDKKLIYLVPEQFTFQADRNLVYNIGERGIHKVSVLSFTSMAQLVLSQVGGITRQHINSSGKNMLIYKILEEVKGNLKVFSKAGKQTGFINIMSEVISELKRYNITPERLAKASSEVGEDNGLVEKLQDIGLIYEKFHEYLHKSYIDTEDQLIMLAEKLEECSIFDGAELWVDEFSSFTPLQYNVLAVLLRKAHRVHITLTTDCLTSDRDSDNTDIFAPVKNTEKRILSIARENNVPYEEPVCLDTDVPYRFRDSEEINHIRKFFFRVPYDTFNKEPDKLSLFKSLNMYSEIQNTAREIIALCRDKGLRFNDIAVITRDLGNYEKLIEAIFSEYGIPYFIDRRRDINGNPLIILLNSVLEIFTKNWSYEAVFRYLKTGLSDIEREEIDFIENYVLQNGIRGKRWLEPQWNYGMDYGFEEDEEQLQNFNRINDIKNKITSPLLVLQEKIKGKRKIEEYCTGIYEFLDFIKAGEKVEEWVKQFKEANEIDMANEYSQVWNVVMELLDQLVEVLGAEEVSLEEFIKILSTGINEYDVGVIPASLDEVLIGSIERVKSHEVSACFIIGANDGVFPRAADEEGILTDRDRETLKGLGVELASDTRSQAFEEQFLIYRAITIGSKYLKISYPIGDFEGKSLRPSMIISRIKKRFPRLEEKSDIIRQGSDEEALEQVAGESSSFNELISAIRSEYEGEKINSIWWDAYRWYMAKDYWRERCKRAFAGLTYNNKVRIVDSSRIRKLYGTPLQLSVSRLERYAQCPFSYYVQYGLKAADRKVYEFSMPDLGSFVHEVLDEFAEVLDKEAMSFRDVDEDWVKGAISHIVDEKVKGKTGFILNSSAKYKYMTDRLKRTIAKSVSVISEQVKRSSFNPVGHETSFGAKGDYPPISIQLPSGDKIDLIGRIDRVDELETEYGIYIRVIDYKSGNKAFKLTDVYYGLQLQLLVYLDAILSNKEKYIEKGVIPGAILYFKVDDPIVNLEDEEDEEKIHKTILKELKMNGLILNDAKIIKEMDNTITDIKGGNSLIIPAQIIGSGEIGKNTSGATEEQFELLRRYSRNMTVKLCEEMLGGNISITPYKKDKNTPCEYCSFKSICQFDSSIKENKYKYLNEKSKEEVWELMKKEVEKEEAN